MTAPGPAKTAIQSLAEIPLTKFGPFISSVRFPRFKNLSPGLEITFDYPITVLIGPNGTNKSSVLRAIQACPDRYNIGDNWFDTPLDPLGVGEGGATDPHRYIHTYLTPGGKQAEVIKARVAKKSRGSDYFETSAPRLRDGMKRIAPDFDDEDKKFRNKTRWKPISKDVEYLDFRQEIPAYDIMMYFTWRNKDPNADDKKKRIRRGAPRVSEALKNLQSEQAWYGKNRILEPADQLNTGELDALSRILGRTYTDVRLVRHDFFGVEGYTAALTTAEHAYSEAYAGSGEFAALMMVRQISRAKPESLIILDEPETSLHPGAQRELIHFIARECLAKKHQVVMATHSPAIVDELPDTARKLLDVDPATGKVIVASHAASAAAAFSRLGAHFDRTTFVVEDELARAFVNRAGRIEGIDFLNSFDVKIMPGGADAIIHKVAPVQAHLQSSCYVMLDGDKRPSAPLRLANDVLDSELQAELAKINLPDSVLMRNGGNADSAQELTRARRAALNWAFTNLSYLPSSSNPDALLLSMEPGGSTSGSEPKSEWVRRTREQLHLLSGEPVTAAQILSVQEIALAGTPDQHDVLVELAAELRTLMSVDAGGAPR